MTFIVPFPGGMNVLTKTFRSFQINTGIASIYTLSGFSFGNANVTRRVCAFVSWSGYTSQADIIDCVIGGVTATKIGGTVFCAGTGRTALALYLAAIPAGTSGAVQFFLNGDSAFGTAMVYTIAGSPTLSQSISQSAATSPAATKTIPAGGVAIAGACNQSSSPNAVWTNLTEDCDNGIGVSRVTSASRSTTPELPNVAMDCSFSAANSAGIFATFAP